MPERQRCSLERAPGAGAFGIQDRSRSGARIRGRRSNSGKGQKIARCPDRLSPDIHVYTESKQPWVVIPAARRCSAKGLRAAETADEAGEVPQSRGATASDIEKLHIRGAKYDYS